MGIAFRELQRCNAATESAEPSLLELCRAPAVSTKSTLLQLRQEEKIFRKKIKFFCESIREPQWKCCIFAVSIDSHDEACGSTA